jgi:hypothetical protein
MWHEKNLKKKNVDNRKERIMCEIKKNASKHNAKRMEWHWKALKLYVQWMYKEKLSEMHGGRGYRWWPCSSWSPIESKV